MKLFIELNSFHDEILYLVIDKFGTKEDIILLNEGLINSDIIELNHGHKHKFSLYRFLKYLIKCNEIYLNTLESPKSLLIFIISSLFRKKIVFTIHNSNVFYKCGYNVKFKKKVFRFFFSKFIKNNSYEYFVLSENVFNTLNTFFKDSKLKLLDTSSYNKIISPKKISKNPFYIIGILGSIDYNRKDYSTISNFTKEDFEKNNIRFNLICDINKINGKEFIEKLKSLEINNYFYYQEGRIPYNELFYVLKNCDCLLNNFKDPNYGRFKASATEIIGNSLKIKLIKNLKNEIINESNQNQ